MINIVKQTIEYYFKNKKEPEVQDIKITDSGLLKKRACLFVTVYRNWEVRWSAGNIKELENNIVSEIIKNTISAITNDERFPALKKEESKNLKLRLDIIEDRKILKPWNIEKLDPVKTWIMAIKKDWENLAVILPNISPKLITWWDFIPVLKSKLGKKFKEEEYQLQEIFTKIYRNF